MICQAIPYEGSEPYMFISYCHKDQEIVYPLLEWMVQKGYRLWYDNGNHGGDNWVENIANHLEESQVMVAFISEASSLSHNCNSEITYGLKCRKRVIPVLLEDADLPKGLKMQLSYLHYLKGWDFASPGELLDKICETEEGARCRTSKGSLPVKSGREDNGEEQPVNEIPSFWERFVQSASVQEGAGEQPEIPQEPEQPEIPQEPEQPEISRRPENPGSDEVPPIEEEPQEKRPEEPKSGSRKVKVQVKTKSSAKPVRRKSAPQPEKPEEEPVQPEGSAGETGKEPVPEEKPGIDAAPAGERVGEPAGDGGLGLETEEDPMEPPNQEKTIRQTTFSPKREEELDPNKTVPMNRQSLGVLLRPSTGQAYIIRKPQVKIGRSPLKCDVVIEGNGTISKQHAELNLSGDKCVLMDCGSVNGTYLKGRPLEANQSVELKNPAVFQINDETLILISGTLSRSCVTGSQVSLLLNEAHTDLRLMKEDVLPLNRHNPWPEGTLLDQKIHREGHALLKREEDGVYLVEAAPEGGNAVHLNGTRLPQGSACLLTHGDRIHMGDTDLEFVCITI